MKSCLSHAIYFYNLYSFLLPTHILLPNLRTIPSTEKYILERFYSYLFPSSSNPYHDLNIFSCSNNHLIIAKNEEYEIIVFAAIIAYTW